MAKALDYRLKDRRITRSEAIRSEETEASLASGVSSRLYADVYKQRLEEALSHPNFDGPGPRWLTDARKELAQGRAGTLLKRRIDGLLFALERKAIGLSLRPVTYRRPSEKTLKWRENARSFEEMTNNRPLKPPTRKP